MTSDSTTKTCTKCGIKFPATAEYFHRAKDSLDGFKPSCKECRCAETRDYASRNPEKVKASKRDWEDRNREKVNARLKQYGKDHPERIKLASKKTRLKHAERDKAKRNHPAMKKVKQEYDKEYYKKNANHIKVRVKQWSLDNPEAVHIYSIRRRARIIGAGGEITKRDVSLQIKSQKGLCWWCGKKLKGKYHVDHIKPLSRGGSNNPDNIVISCPDCNLHKSDKLPHEWIGRLI